MGGFTLDIDNFDLELDSEKAGEVMKIPCPTCGAVNEEPCIRGRKPRDVVLIGSNSEGFRTYTGPPWGGIMGAVWREGKLLGRHHDSRISANKRTEE